MKDHTAARLASSIGAVTLAIFVATVALGVSRPPQLPEAVEPFDLVSFLSANIPLLSFVVVGVLVAARRPANPIGWIFTAAGFVFLFQAFATEYALYSLYTNPGSLPGGALMAWASTWPWVIGVGLIALSILVFPDGRVASRRWRPLAWAIVADTTVTGIGPAIVLWPHRGLQLVAGLDKVPVAPVALQIVFIGFPILMLALFLAAGSLMLRFRRARGDERQQLKWVAYAVGVLAASAVFVSLEGLVTVRPAEAFSLVIEAVGNLAVPAAASIAILKYRLYEIDVIINRTLVYGALTAILGAAYVLIVTVAGTLLQGSDIVTAGATLAVAALFRPLRRRIQGFIDRRFYRRKYDAARTVELFSSRLRDEVDLDAMQAQLVGVVQETMQPRWVSIWLRG